MRLRHPPGVLTCQRKQGGHPEYTLFQKSQAEFSIRAQFLHEKQVINALEQLKTLDYFDSLIEIYRVICHSMDSLVVTGLKHVTKLTIMGPHRFKPGEHQNGEVAL